MLAGFVVGVVLIDLFGFGCLVCGLGDCGYCGYCAGVCTVLIGFGVACCYRFVGVFVVVIVFRW